MRTLVSSFAFAVCTLTCLSVSAEAEKRATPPSFSTDVSIFRDGRSQVISHAPLGATTQPILLPRESSWTCEAKATTVDRDTARITWTKTLECSLKDRNGNALTSVSTIVSCGSEEPIGHVILGITEMGVAYRNIMLTTICEMPRRQPQVPPTVLQ